MFNIEIDSYGRETNPLASYISFDSCPNIDLDVLTVCQPP